jgi:DNA-binding CsgD family transcriptional regulator
VALIGRASELDLVDAFLTSAAASGGAFLLTGDPGVGKTAVLEEAVARATESGTRVARTMGVEFEAVASFSGLQRLLSTMRDELTRLDAAHRLALSVALDPGAGPAPERLVLSTAVVALVRGVATSTPLLLVVDDAQWLDPASVAVLGFVARRLTGCRTGLLAAIRSDAPSILDTLGLPGHELRPLREIDASGLLGTHFPMLPTRVQQRLLAEAEGNPLALLELPVSITARQRSGSALLPDILPLDQRLEQLFGGRIEALPPPSRHLLLLAALEGRGDLAVVQAAAPPHRGISGLDPAEVARLVSIDQDRLHLTFRHPLVRSTVVHLASDDDRRLAHRALGSALVDQPERHAWHLAAAAGRPDEVVAALLEEQARLSLTSGDAVGAVNALSRAADLSPDRADRARRQIEAAYIGADVTGDLRSASQLLETANDAEPALLGSLPAAVAASHLLLNAECELDTAHRLLVSAIEAHPGRHDPEDVILGEALHSLLMLCWFGGRPELWEPFEAATARLAPHVPVLVDVCRNTFGDPVRGAASVHDQLSREIARLHDEHNPIHITRVAIASVYTDRLGECRDALWRVIRDGRSGGAVALAINALVSSCVDDWLTGQWDQVQQLVAEGVALCDRYGYRRYSVILGGYIAELVSVARGDTDRSSASANEVAEWATARGVGMVTTFAHHLGALRAIGERDYEKAYEHASAISPAGVLAPYAPHALWVLFDLIESAVHTGRIEAAAAHVEAMRQADLPAISPRLALLTAGGEALIASDAHASDLFQKALSVPGAERWPFDLARVQLAYGEWLRRSRTPAVAPEPLRDALEILERLGARPWVARARNELRAAGQSILTPGGAGADALTPEERQIALLAASGLTNKQIGERLFLSHRTVGARLYQVFPKLGITSRAALRDALGDLHVREPERPGQHEQPGGSALAGPCGVE